MDLFLGVFVDKWRDDLPGSGEHVRDMHEIELGQPLRIIILGNYDELLCIKELQKFK